MVFVKGAVLHVATLWQPLTAAPVYCPEYPTGQPAKFVLAQPARLAGTVVDAIGMVNGVTPKKAMQPAAKLGFEPRNTCLHSSTGDAADVPRRKKGALYGDTELVGQVVAGLAM
jgi:hypothetical protein